MLDPVSLATGAAALLRPFLPHLLELGTATAEQLRDAIAEKGGEAVWQRAQAVWNKLRARYRDDVEVDSAAQMVAADPADDVRMDLLAQVLAKRLEGDPAFQRELAEAAGGEPAVQLVAGGEEARIRRIRQKMAGPGRQEVRGGDRSTITDVDQEMGP